MGDRAAVVRVLVCAALAGCPSFFDSDDELTWTDAQPQGDAGTPLDGAVPRPDADRDASCGSCESGTCCVGNTCEARSSWAPIPPATITPWRGAASATLDVARRRLVVFGGDYQGTYPDDTWLIDLTSSSPTWVPKLTTGETPPGSYKASLIHDVDGDRAILYGGSRTTDVFALDLEAFNWSILVTANKPANRYGHAAVYDAAGQRMVVFGGKTAAGATSEVWELSLVPGTTPTWTMLTPIGTGPSPRDAVRAAWDEVGRRMFVFGAWPPADDMWILSLASTPAWTRLYPTNVGASARTAPGFVWDAPRSRLIVVAGRGNDMMHSDAWALPILGETAGAWELLQPDDAGPTARDFFPMVLDPVTLWAIMPNGADSWNLALADCL